MVQKAMSSARPDSDFGLIAPTAALSSLPYLPEESMRALRHFMALPHGKVTGRLASLTRSRWPANGLPERYLAIDQGPIIAMIENHRSGLLVEIVHERAGNTGFTAET